ncbi:MULTISPECIES: SDR family NAD(P)-dependent oxidoreductase [unclassified Modestobacter]|uniref:SDR family NAD(P)-dependent oxidoreductase n=1 Tax=unclassified Modestobacter TaxID=2643866 RepID=UPI0022AA91A9|nr:MULTISPECIES: SDR family NAD(P)-dependent oxidoreductase [unclassified Modestobacter]MCZ2822907.1 SDR family NAD(P)-dependent oxidoreductase [Modestobacter sp. VKM Ac-2981]MCZ2851153.1 SDR family NAD(P)-dependent oxidoreductase [Modestobacter sp. VKM Ac-2982]
MEISGARIWVTGASTGIGAALATELADRGARVAISARNAEQLAEVAGSRMVVVPVDVTDRAATVAAGERVREALGGLDVAVLNAGTWSSFHVEPWDSQLFADHLQVNVMGAVHTMEAVVPQMLAAGRGRVVGVASVAGYRGLPRSEAYNAGKAALINLLEGLRGSLAPRGVVVQIVNPGFVTTPADRPEPLPDAVQGRGRRRRSHHRRRNRQGQGRGGLPGADDDRDEAGPAAAGAALDPAHRRTRPPGRDQEAQRRVAAVRSTVIR